MKKALVLYSGGLDSRLVVRMLQDQGFEVTALYFALPFGCSHCSEKLIEDKNIKLVIKDVKKEPLLSEYLEILKNPKFGRGSGINPCKDCKIFMFKKAKEYADKHGIEVIATGEVVGQRPMSQIPSAMRTIDQELGFEILRPLSAKAIKETEVEKKGLVDRQKLLGIMGRNRKVQMELAEKYKIKYPTPGGGCFLCEKKPAIRLKHLLEKNLITEKTLPLTMIGRHFALTLEELGYPGEGDKIVWFVVGRNESESDIISKFKTHIEDDKGKPAVYYSKESGKAKALELQEAYSTGSEDREKFAEVKL